MKTRYFQNMFYSNVQQISDRKRKKYIYKYIFINIYKITFDFLTIWLFVLLIFVFFLRKIFYNWQAQCS